MYQKFSILHVSTGLMDKKVDIVFSLDVDADTANMDSIVLISKSTGKIPEYKIKVSRSTVSLELEQWPEVNNEYLLKVQKGITSIVGDDLPETLQRNIIFKSEITSLVEVLSPADHEELSKLLVFWKETQVQTSGRLVNSFFMEISENNAFYQPVVQTTIVGKENIALSSVPSGRYYLRIRAQEENLYGPWSEIVPFEYLPIESDSSGNEGQEEEEYPVFEEDLSLIFSPVNGETPTSFIFEFDCDIDPDSIVEILVSRRLV